MKRCFYHTKYGRVVEREGYATRISWSKQMLDDLRRLYPRTKNEDVAIECGVSVRTMIRKARELGLQKDPEWMRAHSRANCKTMRILNKCIGNSGQWKRGEHASPEHEFKPGRRVWTDDKVIQLRQLYAKHTSREVADIMGVSVSAINNASRVFGLRKDPDWLRSHRRYVQMQLASKRRKK